MKTPEQMAEEHANLRCPEQGPEFIVWCMCRDDFLAGYQAAKPEWISVKERLPEENELVLIYQPKAGNWVSSHDKHGWGMWENGLTCEPTHWMPLPEVPKHDKE